MGRIDGKVAIVTGSARRIGRATALNLASCGARVVVHAKSSRQDVEAVAQEIRNHGGQATVHLSDVTTQEGADSLAAAAIEAFGRLDLLVNNAAVRRQVSFTEMSFAEWREITSILLDAVFLCSRAAVPHMIKAGGGAIVNIGGVTAHAGADRRAHVSAGKAGVVGLTKALAVELARHNIRVNCVAPGRIGGERSASAGIAPSIGSGGPPLGRLGEVDEAAAMIACLCLPMSGYMTGQTVHVSGGLYMP